jgi:hypothetical protein
VRTSTTPALIWSFFLVSGELLNRSGAVGPRSGGTLTMSLASKPMQAYKYRYSMIGDNRCIFPIPTLRKCDLASHLRSHLKKWDSGIHYPMRDEYKIDEKEF